MFLHRLLRLFGLSSKQRYIESLQKKNASAKALPAPIKSASNLLEQRALKEARPSKETSKSKVKFDRSVEILSKFEDPRNVSIQEFSEASRQAAVASRIANSRRYNAIQGTMQASKLDGSNKTPSHMHVVPYFSYVKDQALSDRTQSKYVVTMSFLLIANNSANVTFRKYGGEGELFHPSANTNDKNPTLSGSFPVLTFYTSKVDPDRFSSISTLMGLSYLYKNSDVPARGMEICYSLNKSKLVSDAERQVVNLTNPSAYHNRPNIYDMLTPSQKKWLKTDGLTHTKLISLDDFTEDMSNLPEDIKRTTLARETAAGFRKINIGADFNVDLSNIVSGVKENDNLSKKILTAVEDEIQRVTLAYTPTPEPEPVVALKNTALDPKVLRETEVSAMDLNSHIYKFGIQAHSFWHSKLVAAYLKGDPTATAVAQFIVANSESVSKVEEYMFNYTHSKLATDTSTAATSEPKWKSNYLMESITTETSNLLTEKPENVTVKLADLKAKLTVAASVIDIAKQAQDLYVQMSEVNSSMDSTFFRVKRLPKEIAPLLLKETISGERSTEQAVQQLEQLKDFLSKVSVVKVQEAELAPDRDTLEDTISALYSPSSVIQKDGLSEEIQVKKLQQRSQDQER